MPRLAAAVAFVRIALLAGCGGDGPPGFHRELHTESTKASGVAGGTLGTLAGAAPRLAVTGLSGATATAAQRALAADVRVAVGHVEVEFSGVPVAPGSDGNLALSVGVTAAFAHLPELIKLNATITGRLRYHAVGAEALGAELADIVTDWLADEKLPGDLGLPTGPVPAATSVAVGPPSCSLHADGSVRCWDRAQDALPLPALTGTTALAAGNNFGVCGIRSDGAAYCVDAWDNIANYEARAVCGIDHATAIGVGAKTACAIVAGGKVRCWGREPGAFAPCGPEGGAVEVTGVTGAVALDVGPFWGCAREADGTVACWEHCGTGCKSGVHGQVEGAPSARPIKALAGTTLVAAGFDLCGAKDGHVICVPTGGGSGKTTTPLPEPITRLVPTSTGTCALAASGAVWCWQAQAAPVAVAGLTGATALDGDITGLCAVTGGAVVCRGGLDDTTAAPAPVAMSY